MNPDPRLIEKMRRAGFVEYLLSCEGCGLSGLGMARPGAQAEDCPKCGEPITLVEAPVTPLKRQWDWRWIARMMAVLSMGIVAAQGLVAAFVRNETMQILALSIAFSVLFVAWFIRDTM